MFGNLGLGGQRQHLVATGPDDGEGVVVAVEAHVAAGHIIGGDHIQFLVHQFGLGVGHHIPGFSGEAHSEGAFVVFCHRRHDVRVFHQGEVNFLGGFFDLVVGGDGGAVVGHGGSGNEHITALVHGFHAGIEHVHRPAHVHPVYPRRGRQIDRPGDQGDPRTGFGGGLGQGEAHFPGTLVGDIAHRVDGLAGRAGGNHHMFAGE